MVSESTEGNFLHAIKIDSEMLIAAILFGLSTSWIQVFHTVIPRYVAAIDGSDIASIQAYCLMFSVTLAVGVVLVRPFDCEDGSLQKRQPHFFYLLGLMGLGVQAFFFAVLIIESTWELVMAAQCIVTVYGLLLMINAWKLILRFEYKRLVVAFMIALFVGSFCEFAIAPCFEYLFGFAGVALVQMVIFFGYFVLAARLKLWSTSESQPVIKRSNDRVALSGRRDDWFLEICHVRVGVSLPVSFVACLLAFGFNFGIVHASTSEIGKVTVSYMPPRLLSALVVILICAILLRRVPRIFRFPWPLLRELVFPALTLTLMSLILISSSIAHYELPLFLVQLSVSFFDLFLSLMIAYMARETQRDVRDFVYVIFGVKSLGSALGLLVGLVITFLFQFTNTSTAVFVSMFGFLVLTFGTFWTGNDSDAKKVWGLRVEQLPKGHHDELREKAMSRIAEGSALTPRETEIALSLALGERPQAIARRLIVSVNTVRAHARAVYRKVGVHSQSELIERLETEVEQAKIQ